MRVLVCGGRNWGNCRWDASREQRQLALMQRSETYDVLNHIHKATPITTIIHGDARGADKLGGKWADDHDIPIVVYPADWKLHGRAAGPIRNSKMIREGKPNLVVAFPGGTGTADMMSKAEERHGVELFVVDP